MAVRIGIEFRLRRFKDGDAEGDARRGLLPCGDKIFDDTCCITSYSFVGDNRAILHVAVVCLLRFNNQGSTVIVDLQGADVGRSKTYD
jgi:hypothetical protein